LDAVDDKPSLSSKYIYFLPLAFDPYPETQGEDKSNRPHVSDEGSKPQGENEPVGGTGSLERDKSAGGAKLGNKPGLNQPIHRSDEDGVKISGILLEQTSTLQYRRLGSVECYKHLYMHVPIPWLTDLKMKVFTLI
jgi:hypothetical protein